MSIDRKILEELKRFNQITSYVLNEQDAPPPPEEAGAPPPAEAGAPPAEGGAPPPAEGGAPPPAEGGGAEEVPEPVDVASDPDVDVVDDDKGEEETEELDITDLVTAQQDIKTKQDEFMNNIFTKLDDLEQKLVHMDKIMNKIDSLENKFEKYRQKTPEEKLELRSLDSYPYNQKLTDFFDDKKMDLEKSGKNEYVLTSDEVENFSPNEIKKTFNSYQEEDEDEF